MSDERPPFDGVRACFYLIAGIIGVHCVVVLLAAVECMRFMDQIVAGQWQCDPKGKLAELLSAALAAALAFAGGFTRNK